ncbi:MAG: DUF3991 and toprim domain-containing protein [Oscillospiraceae bacterium]
MQYYSEEQKEQARQTDMISFLEQFEGFSFKRKGREWHCIEHDSLVIQPDRRGWYWNSQKIGGDNAIAYCQKMKGMTFPEALKTLVGNGSEHIKKAPVIPEEEKQEFILPKKAPNSYRAFAYLQRTRCIDGKIISELMHEEKIYQDNKNNVVFVGIDEEKKPRFACVRGTLSDVIYRGDCLGSDKRFSFSLDGTNSKKLYVFEAPIDLLSHATLTNKIVKNDIAWKVHNRLALSGKTDVALTYYLSKHPNIKELMLCLDNDVAGQTAATEIKGKYEKLGYAVKIILPKQKDFNDDLKAYVLCNEPKPERKPPPIMR